MTNNLVAHNLWGVTRRKCNFAEVVELAVGGGSVINGTSLSSYPLFHITVFAANTLFFLVFLWAYVFFAVKL